MLNCKLNRWFVFAGAWIIIFCVAASAIFSVFSIPLSKLHGWSLAEVNLSFSIYQLFLGIVGILGGRYADKKGAVSLMYGGGFLYGAGWFLTGTSDSIPMLYLTYGVMAGAGAGAVYNATLVTALRWFPDMRGKISGCLLAAAAFGPFVLAPLTNTLFSRIGTDVAGVATTFHILGLLFFCCIAAVGWLMKLAPADYPSQFAANAPGKKAQPSESAVFAEQNYEWTEMIKTPLFWILFFTFMCAGTAGTMMISSTSIIAQTQIGLTPAIGAIAVSISTISNFTGRLSFGVLIDRLGDFKALLISLSASAVALLLLGTAEAPTLFFICVVILGFAFGAPLVVFPPITSRKFGSKNFGINYGIMFLGFTCANYVGPKIAAAFKDATGSFHGAYFAASAIAVLGALIVLCLLRYEKNHQSLQYKGETV
ncbi:OFA family MFS transporter [Sporomusa sp. KB1]|uniref:L-lactate MFS transporter n=1 Tax=Sporomusa sp. KB1 TaxID=943346 RepID=UPI0011ABF96A|nr:OFA family MFS transporter [Sporomusa sp. KB1]TWH45526.1 OFA family oxalate/formate antiporter-like MFS transporter [Sporomusa sp. KB1]